MGTKARPFSTDDERSIWEPNSGCLLWLGGLNSHGYGHFRIGGILKRAHRASYELHKGPIPAGLFVCHSCDNKACINTNHLYVGTRQQNVDDAVRRKRLKPRRGERNGRAKLTDAQAVEILGSAGSQSEIARRFGINQVSVSYIKRGKRHFAAPENQRV